MIPKDQKGHLQKHWPALRARLMAGTYQPQPVRRVSLPKPQGGPLSPLLSNVLLTELDRELERRGHRFCRYADDCNIYVSSERAGRRVMASITRFLEKGLKLQINPDKSAIDRPWRRAFLGYRVTWHRQVRLRIAPKSLQRLQAVPYAIPSPSWPRFYGAGRPIISCRLLDDR